MPRFFFHIRDRRDRQLDHEGTELPDIEAARREAIKRACAIWSEQPPEPDHNDDSFEITDEAGEVVATVPFSEAFAERAVT